MFLLQADFGSAAALAMLGNLGLLAQIVLAILAGFSVFSWAVIVDRVMLYRKAARQGKQFLKTFRSSSKFSQIRTASEELDSSPQAGVFLAGYAEISAQLEGTVRGQTGERAPTAMVSLDALERALMRAAHDQRHHLERGMLFLATTSAVTPFIGLFGTVWGIMSAFHNIGTFGNANLAIVAPGISEALITTAAGLAAAVPALVAYNHLHGRIRDLSGDMQDFGLEFLNVVQKTWNIRSQG